MLNEKYLEFILNTKKIVRKSQLILSHLMIYHAKCKKFKKTIDIYTSDMI